MIWIMLKRMAFLLLRKIIEQCDMILDINGVHLIIEPKSVSAGVDIDELSEVLRSNTSFIYQRAVEKLLKEQPNDKN